MISGYPICCAAWRTSAGEDRASAVPASTGNPASWAIRRAAVLSPNFRSMAGVGPTNVIPASAQACAKSAFSDRNPYPGWIASTSWSRATWMIAGISR